MLKKIEYNQGLALGKVDGLAFCISDKAEAYNENGELVFSWPMDYNGSTNVSIRSLGEFIWISSFGAKVFVEKRKKLTGELIWKYETEGVKSFGDLDEDGNFYMGFSKYQMDSLWILQYQVVKVNSEGLEIWRKAWHARNTPLGKTQTFCQGLTLNKEKNLVVLAGQIQKGENRMNGERSAYIAGLAMSTGEIQWDKTWDYSGTWVSSADGVLFWGNDLFVLSHSYSSSTGAIPNVIYLEKYKVDKVLSVGDPKPTLPSEFRLEQNYPNPFNPRTMIRFEMPKQSLVRLAVYDILGREVKLLVQEIKSAGVYETDFDASELPSGTYFYRLQVYGSSTSIFTETKKMILMK
ncbi:MAG: T9SS type A sorting domain-containing protein [Patescibacteria group bacterium]